VELTLWMALVALLFDLVLMVEDTAQSLKHAGKCCSTELQSSTSYVKRWNKGLNWKQGKLLKVCVGSSYTHRPLSAEYSKAGISLDKWCGTYNRWWVYLGAKSRGGKWKFGSALPLNSGMPAYTHRHIAGSAKQFNNPWKKTCRKKHLWILNTWPTRSAYIRAQCITNYLNNWVA
jgi:hypothetical protein